MAKRPVALERFFTADALAARCVALVDDRYGLDRFDLVLEPSAGGGAFLDLLPPDRRLGIDIAPAHPSVVRADFFDWSDAPPDAQILVIGNPPFGRRGATAVRFVQRACEFASVVAFIVPRNFRKHTFVARVPDRFHLVDELLCDDFVDETGRPVPVPAVFQIWERRSTARPMVVRRNRHPDFVMRHVHLSRTTAAQREALRTTYDFALPQVGRSFRVRDAEAVDAGSQFFVRPLVAGVRERFDRLDFTFLADCNIGHTSLARADIVHAYEQVRRAGPAGIEVTTRRIDHGA